MCFFLENSEVSQIQNKDVAAVAWAALSHTVSSGAIRADESLSSFWVCCSCCVVSGKPLWWLSFIFTSSDLLVLSFWYLCQIERGNFTKLVSEWHRFRLERYILIQLTDSSTYFHLKCRSVFVLVPFIILCSCLSNIANTQNPTDAEDCQIFKV